MFLLSALTQHSTCIRSNTILCTGSWVQKTLKLKRRLNTGCEPPICRSLQGSAMFVFNVRKRRSCHHHHHHHHYRGRKSVNVRTGSGAHVAVRNYKKRTIGLTSRDIATSTIFTGCNVIHSVHCACNHLYTPLCAYFCVCK